MSPLLLPTPGPEVADDDPATDRARRRMAGFMGLAGAMHFVVPRAYESIVPHWIGHERQVVRLSGVAELTCAGLLASRRTRRAGGWLTLATLAAVYPANIQMAIEAGRPRDIRGLAAWVRLPMQLPMFARAFRLTRP